MSRCFFNTIIKFRFAEQVQWGVDLFGETGIFDIIHLFGIADEKEQDIKDWTEPGKK